MELDKEKLLELYPPYTSVLGPYLRPDGRKHVVLNNSNVPSGTKGKTKTISYPKAIVESNKGSKLLENETIDHDNRNFQDDSSDNLIVRDRAEHSALDALQVEPLTVECVYCQKCFIPSRGQINTRSSEDAGPFCSRRCTGRYGAAVQNGSSKIPRIQITKDYYKLDK